MEYDGLELVPWLKVMKGDYGKMIGNAWSRWSEDMQRYCEQDVEVLEALYRHISRPKVTAPKPPP